MYTLQRVYVSMESSHSQNSSSCETYEVIFLYNERNWKFDFREETP